MIVDPRAGHGPGIGGFKADSEIGVAMKAGHPTYFIGFPARPGAGPVDPRHHPGPKAAFLETVDRPPPRGRGQTLRYRQLSGRLGGDADRLPSGPSSSGRSSSPGRRSRYWAWAYTATYPMRYWGRPARRVVAHRAGGRSRRRDSSTARRWCRTSRTRTRRTRSGAKQDNLLVQDRHRARALPRVRENGGAATSTLNAEEMQWIVDELFVGNHLAAGEISTPSTAIDLRNIRSPIVVFCSRGDNITPPQQALDWILDLLRRRGPRSRRLWPDHRLHDPRQRSGTSGSSSRPALRARSTTSSPRTST